MEKFKPAENEKESLKEHIKENEEFRLFDQYVNGLGLTDEDLHKKILDVGSDTGDFANEAKKRGFTEIYSVDLYHPDETYRLDTQAEFGAGKQVVADAGRLPFRNDEFDIVISLYAIPNVLLDTPNKTAYKNTVRNTLLEMLRVGKEVRLGGVVAQEVQGARFSRPEQVDKVFADLRGRGFEISEVPDPVNLETRRVSIRKTI